MPKKPMPSPPSKKKKQKPVLRFDSYGRPLSTQAERDEYNKILAEERNEKIANEVYNTIRIPPLVEPITKEMREAWFKSFTPADAGPSYIPSLHRNPELEGFLKLRSIHPKHTFAPPKDKSELWNFPPPPNAHR